MNIQPQLAQQVIQTTQLQSQHTQLNNNSNNNASSNNQLNTANQIYCSPVTQNNFIQSTTSQMMAVKQPLQQQQYQQFANQNNEIQSNNQQQQFQTSNNLKYYMTNSPVSIGNQQIVQQNISNSSPRVLNFNSNNNQIVNGNLIQQPYVLQDQQNQLNNNNNFNQNVNINSNNLVSLNQTGNTQGGTPTPPTITATGGASTVQNSNGQIFLNINNRIVPIQTLNVKQQQNSNNSSIQSNPINISNNNVNTNNFNSTVIQQASNMQNQQQTMQNSGQRIQILSAVNNNNTNSINKSTINTQQPQMIQIRSNPTQQTYTSNDLSNNTANNDNNSNSNITQQQPHVGYSNQVVNNNSISAEITEKMRQLENIQKQLRAYQAKIQGAQRGDNDSSKSQPTTYTTQQIQAALSLPEQNLLQKLITQRKSIQTEVQSLQQKLVTPNQVQSVSNTLTNSPIVNSSPVVTAGTVKPIINSNNNTTNTILYTNTTNTNVASTTPQQPQPLTKLQLYQQILIKLNTFKNSKTVTIPGTTKDSNSQQQLQLTTEEFDQLKKLLELQNQLQNELNLTAAQIQTIQTNLTNANLISKPIANQTIQIVNSSNSSENKKPDVNSSVPNTVKTNTNSISTTSQVNTNSSKMNEWSLPDKHKVLELIKVELNKLKIQLNQLQLKAGHGSTMTSAEISQEQNQIKERYILLVKKQSEIQVLINQHDSTKQVVTSTLPNPAKNSNSTQSNSVNDSISNSISATIAQVSQKFQAQSSSSSVVQGSSNISQTVSQNIIIPPAPQTIHIVNNITNSPKQAPVKIRNLNTNSPLSQSSASILSNISKATTSLANAVQATEIRSPVIQRTNIQNNNIVQNSPSTPLRALVINNNSNQLTQVTSQNVIPTLTQNVGLTLIPLAQVLNLQKLQFSNVKFKCLNFEELGQHGIITKNTENATIDLIKELDNRASLLSNPDQVASFAKNQVKLVKKFLEQQQLLKNTIRNRFQTQLLKEQKMVTELSDTNRTAFNDRTDFLKRLAPYHILQKTEFEPSEDDHEKFDENFEKVSEKLLKKADAMKKRFHLFQLRSMQKEVESTEATLIMKLFVDDLKLSFESEKNKYKEEEEDLIKRELEVREENKKQKETEPNSFKHLILSNKNSMKILSSGGADNSEGCTNINDDFNLNLISQSNPMKRHLKTEDFDDDPDDFQDEYSTHRTIKHHSPNFTTKLLQNTKNSNIQTPETSFNASSSSSSTTSNIIIPNFTLIKSEKIVYHKNEVNVNLISEKNETLKSSCVNSFNNNENNISKINKSESKVTDFVHNNKNIGKNIDNSSISSISGTGGPSGGGYEIIDNQKENLHNSTCSANSMNISNFDGELVLNEEDLAVQSIMDY